MTDMYLHSLCARLSAAHDLGWTVWLACCICLLLVAHARTRIRCARNESAIFNHA
eukprot:COSAG05_NODE_1880_length_3909_cov_1.531234_6_plen_55_part_00